VFATRRRAPNSLADLTSRLAYLQRVRGGVHEFDR
jgi:hypothetical protein